MDVLKGFFQEMWSSGGAAGIAMIVVLLAALIVQMRYWVGIYGRIPTFRNTDTGGAQHVAAGISVIVIVRGADYEFIEQKLPAMLAQDHSEFEIVVMDISDDPDFSFALTMLSDRMPRMEILRLAGMPILTMSNKMLLNVGIKGAKYENVVFTTPDCMPDSDKWLAMMERGFGSGDMVIGYCGIAPGGGVRGSWWRMERAAWSMRWLAAAMKGVPYRGTVHNIGIKKKIYFDNGGFNYLNINAGEDDLFVQKLAGAGVRTAVVAAGRASTRQTIHDGWYQDKKATGMTYGLYPGRVKAYIGAELWSRALFFAAAVGLMVVMPGEVAAAAGCLLLLRFVTAAVQTFRICKRLGERSLMGIYLFYDLFSPLMEAWLAVGRSFRKPR